MVTRSKRSLQWYTTISRGNSVAAAGQQNTHLLTDMDVDLAKDSTVTRLLLEIWFRAPVITVEQHVYYGVVFVNNDAVIAGALPDPSVQADTPPWLVRGWEGFRSANLSDSTQDGRVRLDIRSQRICRTRADQLHLIVDQPGGANPISYDVFARTLVRHP